MSSLKKICTRCGEEKPTSLFGLQRCGEKIYIRPHCKACDCKITKAYRATPAGKSSRRAEGLKRYRAQRALYKSIKAQQACLICGENEPCCIDFHHLKPAAKRRILVDLVFTSFTRLKEEICKCVALCANCHRKFHAGKLKLPPGTKPISMRWIKKCEAKARIETGLPAKPKKQINHKI